MIRFTLFGIKFFIGFMFVALVTVYLIVDKSGIAAIGLAACFIHELGHICMFFAVGLTPLELHFEFSGIRIVKPVAMLSYYKEVLVQIAGSVANLSVFFLLCGTIDGITTRSIFAVTHLILGVFNLLPIKSFDGGKLLELTLIRFCTIKVTEIICTIVDTTCLLTLFFASMYGYYVGNISFTLVILSALLLTVAIMRPLKR